MKPQNSKWNRHSKAAAQFPILSDFLKIYNNYDDYDSKNVKFCSIVNSGMLKQHTTQMLHKKETASLSFLPV
jgi:hypothetical protein